MVSGHDHVLVRDGGWYQCQVVGCDYGLFDFEMPLLDEVSQWAEQVTDIPLTDWQRQFLDGMAGGRWPEGIKVEWRNPIVPNRRGKSAAYARMIRDMEQAGHGPGEAFRSPDGRERGRIWRYPR